MADSQVTRESNINDPFLRAEGVMRGAKDWLLSQQNDDGHWAFELEADATIPAEYIMHNHYLGEPNDEVEQSTEQRGPTRSPPTRRPTWSSDSTATRSSQRRTRWPLTTRPTWTRW